jgi:hypothetical protein
MALTLRPTGLQTSAAFAHLADWSVYDDGRQIGRLREEHAPPRPGRAWYWSITVLGPGRGRVRTEGHAASLDISGMLRMRKKPPSDRPNINSGQPWSEMDMADLFEMQESGVPVEKIADYLCREVDEVQAKIASLRN